MKFRWHLYVLPLFFLIITLYFTFHLIQGERGIFRLSELQEQIAKGEMILQHTNAQKNQLEKKVSAISLTHVQDDVLDELARHQMGVLKADEYVIYD